MPIKLTPPHVKQSWAQKIMHAMTGRGGTSCAEIATAVSYPKRAGELSAVLSQLVSRGMLFKTRSTGPGRTNLYSLSPLEEMAEATARICTRCCVEKPLDAQHWYLQSRNGVTSWMGICKSCRRSEVARKSRANVRDKCADEIESEAESPGRLVEYRTDGGRMIRFGDDWRPGPDCHHRHAPGLIGYQSALARIEQ